MKRTGKRNSQQGFTLMELLTTVGILVALFALVMIPATQIRREIRQTELDSRAEMVFMAVQNRMTQLQASGQSGVYQTGAAKLGLIPRDAEKGKYTEDDLVYVTSRDKTAADSPAYWIYPEEGAEPELWNGNWVVEYDPASGSVYAVFWSETAMNYTPESFNELRYRNKRLKNGALVGYYGGDSVGASQTGELQLRVSVINQEQLQIVGTCDAPAGDSLSFFVTLTDEDGNTTGELQLRAADHEVVLKGATYTATMTLDNLAEGEDLRFCQQARLTMLTPGQNLTVRVRVHDEDNPQVDDDIVVVRDVNSLFASVSQDAGSRTARIAYGRHLQNLDQDSGLGRETAAQKKITQAVQTQDVQFSRDSAWQELYPGQNFVPIRNDTLKLYDSTWQEDGATFHPAIDDLPVDTAGDAGLFAFFAGELRNIRLAGAKIKGTEFAGGLVGRASGDLTITGCQVFLSAAKGHLTGDQTEPEPWIRGDVAGGLVGGAISRSVTVTDSFAATVIFGETEAGGLLGRTRRDVTVTGSYADCYVFSNETTGKTGGLVATCQATATVTLTDCYTAGFLKGGVTAGLTASEISAGDALTGVYSACASMTETPLTHAMAERSGAAGPAIQRVFYLAEGSGGSTEMLGAVRVDYQAWSGENRAAAAELLGGAFSADNAETYPYNLMKGLGLSLYSFPKLAALPHYGDWKSQFESGSLVYYETYPDGSFGFYGGNVSCLSDDGAVSGDGYGMIYGDEAFGDVEVVQGGTAYTLKAADKIAVPVTENGVTRTYYLLPLPAALVQDAPVPAGGFYTSLTAGSRMYFYNPHFARTALSGTTQPQAPEQVSVRSARQLFALSEFYADYARVLPKAAAFQQGCDIDYSSYDWIQYGRGGMAVSSQRPIGRTRTAPFAHTYDGGGYVIREVSFASSRLEPWTGLFGCSTGKLRNIVLATKQALTLSDGTDNPKLPTARVEGLPSGTVYLGALAGWNGGTVANCAAAGYRLSAYAYQGSVYYVGGLVGYNDGTIRTSSASIPLITGTSTYAGGYYVGGLVGGNRGQIRQSYAASSIEVMEIRGSRVVVAGFAGENLGTIRNSYCASALNAVEGASVYGFAPDSGSVTGCYYLSGGTYTFAGTVYLYEYAPGSPGAAKVTSSQLSALRLAGFGAVDQDHTPAGYFPNTRQDADGGAYPHPGSVTGRDGAPVHYGDWVTMADMGTMGMIYWEQEEGGANAGYHFSYQGYDGTERKQGSSLCTAHDDGGAIHAYGYAYYWRKDTEAVTLTASVDDGTAFALGSRSAAAEQALSLQAADYTFVAYETGITGMHLSSSATANGQWLLTQGGVSHTFRVCPFFAQAYSDASEPGFTALPYQVRSVDQLQFINWSWNRGAGSVSDYVTEGNFQTFPYLQYTTIRPDSSGNRTGTQTRADALAGDSVGGPRPVRSWKQTHDVSGTDLDNPTDGKKNQLFYPIAGAVNYSGASTGRDAYRVTLYNWFGGNYDGQSYYVKNIRIDSCCYNVGLFGTTTGATIESIILYSDNSGVIQRSSKATSYPYSDADPAEYQTSYALGGLAGIVYDYANASERSTVSNCAIAGYTVQDNSKNKLRMGEAAVGGLFGVANANLTNCSAVVAIEINCTHRWGSGGTGVRSEGGLNAARWGNFIRVGGLVGGLRHQATNCYTGGSITVGAETLKERVKVDSADNKDFCTGLEDDAASTVVKWSNSKGGGNESDDIPATYVYLGGVGGSGFSANFMNFTGASDRSDGTPVFVNCYTYLKFPAMTGTITGMMLIGGPADRQNYISAQVKNCYYLKQDLDFTKLSKYRNQGMKSLAEILSTENAQMAMLESNMNYLNQYFSNSNAKWQNVAGLTGLTYDQMSDRTGQPGLIQATTGSTAVYDSFLDALGSGYAWVSIDEDGAPIHGKYSFPGNDEELAGQNYPFPTVLTQRDTLNRLVHLHFGQWPKVGMFWSRGILSMDLIADYDTQVAGKSAIRLKLNFNGVKAPADAGDVTFTCDESVVRATAQPNGAGFDVILEGTGAGATEVIAAYGGYTARLMVTVTAELTVKADPAILTLYTGEEKTVSLKAYDSLGAERTVTWQLSTDDGAVAGAAASGTDGAKVTGLGEGETVLRVTAVCRLDGSGVYEGSGVVPVEVLRQPVLGIANVQDPAAPRYRQGTVNRALTDWDPAGPFGDTADVEKPVSSYHDSNLFLYTLGQSGGLDGYTLAGVTVTGPVPLGTGTAVQTVDALTSPYYRITAGQVDQYTGGTIQPLTLKGWQTGQVTLSVTLQNTAGGSFVLTIPYTLEESDTRVTASFAYPRGTALKTVTVPFGTAPGVQTGLLTDLTPPSGYVFADPDAAAGWTPDPEAALYADGVFTPVLIKGDAHLTFTGISVAETTVTVAAGESLAADQWPASPSRDGYVFIGWTPDDGATVFTGGSYTPDGDKTFRAVWRKEVTVVVTYVLWGSPQTVEKTTADYENGLSLEFWTFYALDKSQVVLTIDGVTVTDFTFTDSADFYGRTNTVTIPASAFPADQW